MTNDPISKIITSTIDGFVKDGKMFSAYDVTLKIRGMGISCKHHAVKADIHSTMSDVIDDGSEDYEKTLVNTGKYRTYVYHRSTDDAHKYNQSDDATTTTTTPVAPVAPAKKPTGAQIVAANTNTLHRDKRGRICLPADMLRSIGATVGKKVMITPNAGEVIVSSFNHMTPAKKDSHVYKVDRDNNVRISAKIFDKALLGTFNTFVVKEAQGSIKVF